jgi:hypothetical protein
VWLSLDNESRSSFRNLASSLNSFALKLFLSRPRDQSVTLPYTDKIIKNFSAWTAKKNQNSSEWTMWHTGGSQNLINFSCSNWGVTNTLFHSMKTESLINNSHMAHLCFSLYRDLFSWDTPVTPKGAKALTSIRTKLSNICISSTTCSWRIAQYVVVEWLAHLLRNWEESGSNLGPESGYPEWGLYGFPQSLQANAGMVP